MWARRLVAAGAKSPRCFRRRHRGERGQPPCYQLALESWKSEPELLLDSPEPVANRLPDRQAGRRAPGSDRPGPMEVIAGLIGAAKTVAVNAMLAQLEVPRRQRIYIADPRSACAGSNRRL